MENGSLNLLKKEVCKKEVKYNTTIPAVSILVYSVSWEIPIRCRCVKSLLNELWRKTFGQNEVNDLYCMTIPLIIWFKYVKPN